MFTGSGDKLNGLTAISHGGPKLPHISYKPEELYEEEEPLDEIEEEALDEVEEENPDIVQIIKELFESTEYDYKNLTFHSFLHQIETNIQKNLSRILQNAMANFQQPNISFTGLHRYKRTVYSTCVTLVSGLGTYVGGTIGATVGSTLLSFLPIIGTAVGAYFGGMYGAQYGRDFAESFATQYCTPTNFQNPSFQPPVNN